MQFIEATQAADEATMRSMLAADPGLRDGHADLVARTAEARNWSTVRLLIDFGFGVSGVSAAGATARDAEHADEQADVDAMRWRQAGWHRYRQPRRLGAGLVATQAWTAATGSPRRRPRSVHRYLSESARQARRCVVHGHRDHHRSLCCSASLPWSA